MKKIIIPIFICYIISYLIVSFVKWQFNCGLWGNADRAAYIFFTAVMIPLIFIFEKFDSKS